MENKDFKEELIDLLNGLITEAELLALKGDVYSITESNGIYHAVHQVFDFINDSL